MNYRLWPDSNSQNVLSLIVLFTDVVIYYIARLRFTALRLDGVEFTECFDKRRISLSPKLYPLITGVPEVRFCVHFFFGDY